MEQKTEASQAVEERADMIAALSMCAAALAQGSNKRSRDIACEYACEALRRAALKAQPAPTEATEKPFGYFIVEGDDLPYPGSGFIRELAEGRLYRSVTPVYTRPAPTEAAQGEDSARLDWKRITAPGQVKVGDKLRFSIGDEKFRERVKQIINEGRADEELIYNKRRNFYVITSNAITNFGSSKNVEYLARASAETGGVKS